MNGSSSTAFGAWFQTVKAREEKPADADAGSPSWRFWERESADSKDKIESGGLLPSFMSRSQPEPPRGPCDLGLSRTQRVQVFVALLVIAAVLLALSLFVFLPMALLFPAKFASTFSLGSILFMSAFAILKGPWSHIKSLFTKDRIVFSLAYIASLSLTLYAAIIAQNYIMIICSAVVQILALVSYGVSYLPHGRTALKMMWMMFTNILCTLAKPCMSLLSRSSSSTA